MLGIESIRLLILIHTYVIVCGTQSSFYADAVRKHWPSVDAPFDLNYPKHYVDSPGQGGNPGWLNLSVECDWPWTGTVCVVKGR